MLIYYLNGDTLPCNNLISDTTIENIYKDDNLITNNQVNSQCIDDNTKKSFIKIYHNDEYMLERDIERTYFREKELYSDDRATPTGKVVKHEYFILKNNFQGNGIIKKVHPKELDAYRVNDFKEIHLKAAWAGLVVWKKMFYKFKSKKHENLIKIAIQRYLREVKGMSTSEISNAIKSDLLI